MEKEKVKTTIQIDRKIWAEIKKEATLTGKTVSQIIEEKLGEATQKC